MLTLRIAKQIGKPGQSSTKVGRNLNSAANDCALDALAQGTIAPSVHATAIHPASIVEAFPSSFLGLLLGNPAAVPATRHDRSDRFYAFLAEGGQLGALVASQLPGRRCAVSLRNVKNHDDRASLVCALTALCLASGDYSAVGNDSDGWIILPPLRFIAPWAIPALRANEDGNLRGRFVSWNHGRQLVL
ncbi:MAG: hypothetical protein P0Y65_02595 [Candidatus Devosia phytovorans]|uniref:Uncharacterized protein n=1 Tax=Candidatus Devosia phytovorans TaxID=3121372 RepID=A0AAJ5VX96_9HYPH|nr:hypothetical protein [Devosia sp.]WEK05163.1 MAG: hypothetical protein P0Y65_02595 [Devosia sp.]